MTHILDIRTPEEYCSGHILGAHNIPTPLPPLNREQIETLERRLLNYISRRVYSRSDKFLVYCKLGKRSSLATRILRGYGFEVRDLGGLKVGGLKLYAERYPYKIRYC